MPDRVCTPNRFILAVGHSAALLVLGTACISGDDRPRSTHRSRPETEVTPESIPARDQSSPLRKYAMSLHFSAAPAEEARIDTLISQLSKTDTQTDLIGGGVYRLTADNSGQRYVLLTFIRHEGGSQERRTWGLYVLETGEPQGEVSEPFDLGIPTDVPVAVDSVADFDQDGNLEILICRWPNGPEQPGRASVVSLRSSGTQLADIPKEGLHLC